MFDFAYQLNEKAPSVICRITFLALILFTFVLPWGSQISVPFLQITYVTIIGRILTLLWLIKILLARRIRAPHRKMFILILYIAWLYMSLFWSVDRAATLRGLHQIIPPLLYFFMIWDMLEGKNRQESLYQAYVIGSYLCVFAIIINAIFFANIYRDRYTAINLNPNELAFIILLAAPFALHLLQVSSYKKLYWVNFLYPFLAFVAVLLTCSRAAYIAVVFSLIYQIYLFRGFRKREKIIASIASVICTLSIIILFFHSVKSYIDHPVKSNIDHLVKSNIDHLVKSNIEQPVKSNIEHPVKSNIEHPVKSYIEHPKHGTLPWFISTSDHRITIWKNALILFPNHPLLGYGYGTFSEVIAPLYGRVQAAHNVLIQMLVEVGIIGALLFLGCSIALLIMIVKFDTANKTLFLVLSGIWFTGLLTQNYIIVKPTWLLISLIFSLHAMKINIDPRH